MTVDREPLGAGAIIGETFAILFRRFGHLFSLAILPALALGYIELQQFDPPDLSGPINIPGEPSASGWSNETALTTASMFARSVVAGVVAAAMAHLVFKLKTGQPIAFRELVSATLRSIPRTYTILILLLIASVLTASLFTIGVVYLSSTWGISPWLSMLTFYPAILGAWTLFCMAVPVSAIEGLWVDAFARTLRLTKAYRWRCVGIYIAVVVAVFMMIAAIEFPLAFTDPDFHYGASTVILSVATYVLLPACLTIAATLIYLRLRDIKEGGIAEQVERVFA